MRYPRNVDLDPQLVWRGKDEQDWSDSRCPRATALHSREGPSKVLIDDLDGARPSLVQTAERGQQISLFADFNGIPKDADRPSSTRTTRTGRTG